MNLNSKMAAKNSKWAFSKTRD